MAGMSFKKATKKMARLRLAIGGPSGSGKTWTSLAVASTLGARVAVIDTERGSASLYANDFSFDVLELQDHSPDAYVEAIHAAERADYDVIVIDSLSHAWMGKGGALEQVDAAAKRSKSGNSFTAWRDVTPMHNALVDAMLQSPAHLIATVRSKTEWVLEEDSKGKKTPRKVGLAWVQREGLDFEFTVVGDMDLDHSLVISKTRCPKFAGAVLTKPGAPFGADLLAWLNDGEASMPAPVLAPRVMEPSAPPPAPPSPAEEAGRVREELNTLAAFFGGMDRLLTEVGKPKPTKLTEAKAVLAAAKDLHAYRIREQQEADAAFSVDGPSASGRAPLQVLDGGNERPTTDRAEKAREVVAHGEGAAKGGKAPARGAAKKSEAKPNPDRPTDEEWAAFYAKADAGMHGSLNQDEIRDDFIRVMGLESSQDATRAHLKRYLLSMEDPNGIAVGDPGDTENGDREDDDPANAHVG